MSMSIGSCSIAHFLVNASTVIFYLTINLFGNIIFDHNFLKRSALSHTWKTLDKTWKAHLAATTAAGICHRGVNGCALKANLRRSPTNMKTFFKRGGLKPNDALIPWCMSCSTSGPNRPSLPHCPAARKKGGDSIQGCRTNQGEDLAWNGDTHDPNPRR